MLSDYGLLVGPVRRLGAYEVGERVLAVAGDDGEAGRVDAGRHVELDVLVPRLLVDVDLRQVSDG